ncbi:MAG: ABC transporter permease, partial [Acidobacteriota bacterium]|nr:ABC transporter permease [Acidobacteriota bacterium]
IPDSERIVVLNHTAPGLMRLAELPISERLGQYYAEESRTLEHVTLFGNGQVSFTGPDNPERVEGAQISHQFFPLVRTRPQLGRGFIEEDELSNAPPVVVLSDGLWHRRFGGDPTVVGRRVDIDGAPTEIIGVMPPGFSFVIPDTQLWQAIHRTPDGGPLGNFGLLGLARVADGHTIGHARAELTGLTATLVERFPDEGTAAVLVNAGFAPIVERARDFMVGDTQATLWLLLGTVGFLLLIACANVANLFLARSEARHRELAIRIALGEGRPQVVGSMLLESVCLGLMGGLVAVPISLVAVRMLVRFGPPELPRLAEISVDTNVLLFGAGLSVLAGVLFGVMPALRAAAIPPAASLTEGARGASAARGHHLIRRVLVVAQLALALTLLVGSGLATRSFQRLMVVDPGFDPSGVLTFRLALPEQRYTAAARLSFHRALLERLQALPGASQVATVSSVPLSGSLNGSGAAIEGQPREDGDVPPVLMTKRLSPGYFAAMRIERLEGRDFERLDNDRGTPVAIVTRSVARGYWPGESAIGKGIRQGPPPGKGEEWFRIVGVVDDVHETALHQEPPELVYYPLAVDRGDDLDVPTGMTFVLRGADTNNFLTPARGAVRALDPTLPISDLQTMDSLLDRARVQRSFVMVLLVTASVFAVLLSAIGLYGVISYVVAQRRREIAIRMAIGARLADIRRLVLVEAGWMALVGTGLGIGVSVALTRRLQSLLFETSPLDPVVFLGVSLLLATICLVASWIPARRAASVEPVHALRAE